MSHIVTQTAPYAGHFEGVGQSVVHEYTAWQRKHLGLVLQASERGREDEAIVVTSELSAVIHPIDVQVFLPESFIRYQLLPIHSSIIRKEELGMRN